MQQVRSEAENSCFFKIVQNHAQKMRLEKWCISAPVELKKVLSAQSYGHFTAALEFWSQCRILTFCRSTLQAKVGRFLRDPGDLRPLADLSWFSGDAAIAKGSWPYRPTLYKKLTVHEIRIPNNSNNNIIEYNKVSHWKKQINNNKIIKIKNNNKT